MNSRREIWTREHGKIPKGYISLNLNGQSADDRVENIAVIPRSSNLRSIVAPFIGRIRKLERKLKLLENEKEKDK